MKLISCHIENFGKLTNFDYNFDGNLTVICEENGYGKSTLAVFLKAVFFGMDTSKKIITLTERRHYLPFNGGKYGGYAVVEKDGKEYKIVRFFDGGNGSGDTVTVYDNKTGKETDELNGDVGYSLFQIDRDAFERSAFLNAENGELNINDTLKAKIMNLTDVEADVNNYENAIEMLDKKRKEYKTTGNKGKINEIKNNIKTLSDGISRLKGDENLLKDKTERLNALNSEFEKKNSIKELYEKNTAVTGERSALNKRISETEEELKRIDEEYPLGTVTEEETVYLRQIYTEIKTLNALNSSFERFDNERFKELEGKFLNKELTDEEINSLYDSANKLNISIDGVETKADINSRERARLFGLFGKDGVTETLIEEKRAEYLTAKKERDAVLNLSSGKANKTAYIFAVIGILGLVGGIITSFFNLLIGLIIAIGVGVVPIIAFIIFSRSGSASEITSAQNKFNKAELLAKEFLTGLGVNLSDKEVTDGFNVLLQDYLKYVELINAENFEASAREKRKVETEKHENAVIDALIKYGYVYNRYDLVTAIRKLDSDRQEYKSMKETKQKLDGNRGENKEKIKEYISKITDVLKKYGLSYDAENFESDLYKYERAHKNKENCKKAIQRDKAELSGIAIESGKVISEEEYDGLKEEISALNKELTELNKEIEEINARIETIPDLTAEKERNEEELSLYEKRHERIVKTIDTLKQANENMIARYLKPLQESYVKYSSKISTLIDSEKVINADLKMGVEEFGERHGIEYMSSGYKSAMAICIRLALMEVMYHENKPFLIMDDPFVYLDDEKMQNAMEILKVLSNETQIIYFTCSKSRV